MTRPIKFRAWDKHSKEMYEDITYDKEAEEGVRPWVFMQYTGLTDKNGKEIYEGDILYDNFEEGIFKVVWENASFVVEDLNGIGLEISEDCKIIGNIHKTPELLEKYKEKLGKGEKLK